jgi:uncharacterized membrane protein (UPF0127 family)
MLVRRLQQGDTLVMSLGDTVCTLVVVDITPTSMKLGFVNTAGPILQIVSGDPFPQHMPTKPAPTIKPQNPVRPWST